MNHLTLKEVMERLQGLDEMALVELLRLDAEQIVQAFEYLIEERLEELERIVNEYD